MPIIQIGLVDNDLAKNFPAEIALKADVRETLRVLVPAIEVTGGVPLATLASDRIESLKSVNWSANRDRLVQDISRRKDAVPIDPDWLALQVVDALPANAILVDEGLTSSRYMAALKRHRDRYGYHQMASGGIGWGLPASVGASLANPERPVVCYSGDGSAMYSIQSLWTAAHHNLPLTVVLLNNGGYRIIKQRLQGVPWNQPFCRHGFPRAIRRLHGSRPVVGCSRHSRQRRRSISEHSGFGDRTTRTGAHRSHRGWRNLGRAPKAAELTDSRESAVPRHGDITRCASSRPIRRSII